jgi:hypothetical protein
LASAASALTTLRPHRPTDIPVSVELTTPPLPTAVAARCLTTADAARYCGFKTPSAIRKAHMEGRVKASARRGGKGTWVWSVADLDRFMRVGSRRSTNPRAARFVRRRCRTSSPGTGGVDHTRATGGAPY